MNSGFFHLLQFLDREKFLPFLIGHYRNGTPISDVLLDLYQSVTLQPLFGRVDFAMGPAYGLCQLISSYIL